MALSKAEWPVEDATRYLSSLSHFAERSRFDSRRNFRGHGFNRGQDHPWRAEADLREQVDRVWTMSRLASRSGKILIAASVIKSVSA
jgi:hypothetical protein